MADPTPNPVPNPTPTPNPNPAAFDWKAASVGLDADAQVYVETKGFKGIADVVTSYRNFEKLHGQADKLLKLPTGDTPEEWKPVWAKLGAGAAATDYKLPVPAGQKDDFAKLAANWFHEIGVPVKMAEKIVGKWNDHQAAEVKKASDAYAAKLDTEVAALKAKWGAAHDQNAGLASRAAKAFGIDGATIDQLEEVMGYAKVMEMFHGFGTKMGEGDFVTGDNNDPGFNGSMKTPEQAQAEIKELRSDNAFIKKFTSGDVEAKNRMERLHKQAYPGENS